MYSELSSLRRSVAVALVIKMVVTYTSMHDSRGMLAVDYVQSLDDRLFVRVAY